jgi:hypothetical protein
MSALLRYAFMKSTRDHLLPGLLLAPLVLVCAPLFGMAFVALSRGEPVYPLHLPDGSPQQTSEIFGVVAVVVSALVAGIGSFWVFRSEIASRTVHFFFLAHPPRTVSAASAIYGFIAGVLACGISRTAIMVLTATPQEHAARDFAVAAVSAWIASALGALLVAISSEAAILVIVYAVVLAATTQLQRSATLFPLAIAILFGAALLQGAAVVLRWRCAS